MSEIESETRAASAQKLKTGETMPAHWRWNFVANFLDISFFSLALAFASLTTIVPLFIRELGGSTLLVGLAPALVQLGWVLPPLFVAPYIGRLRRKLPYVLRMTLGERIPWVILALLTLWLGRERPGLVLGLSVILLATFGLSGGLAMPAWMDMVASTIPLRMRGKLFGWSGALGGFLGIGGGLLAERFLKHYPFPGNFVICFAAAAICMALSYAALFAIREPEPEHSVSTLTTREYMRRLPALLRGDRDFSAFLLARVMGLLGGMAVAFVTIYAAEQRGLPASLAGRYTAWMLGSQVITTPIWGALGDRHGHKGALQFGMLCAALAPALALMVGTPIGFYAIFTLLGASGAILGTTTLNMVLEFAVPEERVTYIGLHGTLVAPATLIAPLAGGWLTEYVGFGALFVVAALFSTLGLAILTFLVRDPRHRQLTQAVEPAS